MDERKACYISDGRKRCPALWVLRQAGKVAGAPYAGAMRLRRWAYRRGLLASHEAEAPVICVGNVTVGGTGKTPMVAWIVQRLKEMGVSAAILTRGYKAVDGVSDEAELLKQLTDAPVIINPDRVAGAAEAVAGGAGAIVMDDGFQHRRLRRDLDIVLIDATNPFGGGGCLPFGRLRESPAALRDAHAVIITRSDMIDGESLAALDAKLRRLAPCASIHTAVHEPTRLADETGSELPLESLAGKKAFAFAGLANPGPFFGALAALGAELTAEAALADHVYYEPKLLAELAEGARGSGAEAMVTTAKDRVKIADPAALPLPLWTLEIEMRLRAGEAELMEKLHRLFPGVASQAAAP